MDGQLESSEFPFLVGDGVSRPTLTVTRRPFQSPVAFAMSSPTFLGLNPSGPIFGARAELAPTSPPVARSVISLTSLGSNFGAMLVVICTERLCSRQGRESARAVACGPIQISAKRLALNSCQDLTIDKPTFFLLIAILSISSEWNSKCLREASGSLNLVREARGSLSRIKIRCNDSSDNSLEIIYRTQRKARGRSRQRGRLW